MLTEYKLALSSVFTFTSFSWFYI